MRSYVDVLGEKVWLGHPCRIASVSTTQENNPIHSDAVCLGVGLTKAVAGACARLGPGDQIAQTVCDLNGEPYRADEFGYTVVRTSQYFRQATDVDTPADCWGDMGAASGPLFLGLSAIAARKRYAKGPWSVAWASSESGYRSCALLNLPLES